MDTTGLEIPEVQLSGENGNAFAVLGRCTVAMKRAGWPKEKIDEFRKEAMAGDYDHLLQTAMKYTDVS